MLNALWNRFHVSLSASGVIPSLALVICLCVVAIVVITWSGASEKLITGAISNVSTIAAGAAGLLGIAIAFQPKPAPDPEVRKVELEYKARHDELHYQYLSTLPLQEISVPAHWQALREASFQTSRP